MSNVKILMVISLNESGVVSIVSRPSSVSEANKCAKLAEVTTLSLRFLHDTIREAYATEPRSTGVVMYTCTDCDKVFDEIYKAFIHLREHDNASEETKARLEALFEWQRLQYSPVSITLGEYQDLLNKVAELKHLLDFSSAPSPEGNVVL